MTYKRGETYMLKQELTMIRTVLKAVNVAIHRALAPDILNVENWRASRRIAGWMSPLAALTGLGNPKCENIRKLRAFNAGGSLIDILLDSLGALAPGVNGGLGVPSPLFLGLFAGGGVITGGGTFCFD